MEDRVRVARTTGLLYLGLAISGLLGHLVLRAQLYDADDGGATLTNLVQHETTARIAIALELTIVLTQTLAGLWFFRLFRSVDSFTAGALVAFSFVNAVVILISAGSLATALEVALDDALASADTVQLMYVVSDQLWLVGELFFGLWLVPMGQLVLRSGWMPAALGWILVAGGIGYVAGPFAAYLLDVRAVADLLVVPASIGEFWIVGYLLVRGVRRPASSTVHDRTLDQVGPRQ